MTRTSDVGSVFVSSDGLAKLMMRPLTTRRRRVRDYREHVLEAIYAGASIDYAPVRRSWFVLSGTRDDTVFYERVSFTCDGRRNTSLAMLYPYAQRHYYNRILEKIARTFHPSRTAEVDC